VAARKPKAAEINPRVAPAFTYAEDVIAGRQAACRFVRLACKRFLDDVDAAKRKASPWEFRDDLAARVIVLCQLLPNIKGPEAGRPLRLMDWQVFILANLFGFVERGTTTRRFRQAVVFVPRGNGKTSLAAPLSLFLSFVEGEGGAEGYAAAVTRDQARILFDTAQEMVRRSPEFRSRFGVEAMKNAIFQTSTASRFIPISSDAKSLDGKNVQVAVCDEIASHKTSAVYDVLLTAMGKRKHPLLVAISTATGNTTGIGKQLWDYVIRLLEGVQQDDRMFGILYTIDEKDDPWDEAIWVKANPGWGQTVQPDAIRAIMRQARNNAAQEAAALTKHLNVWVGADEALFSTRAWRECSAKMSLEDLEGEECHLALDLASKTDLASIAAVFPTRGPESALKYRAFGLAYLNEAAVMEARNASYPGWSADGFITVTEGNETDFGRIEDDLLDLCARFKVLSVAYDPWAATQFAQRMIAAGVPMVEFRATTQNFSEPTKELDAAMRAGRLSHDGNPVTEWCIGNVVGRYDARSNVYPRKVKAETKIDAAISLIMAIARCMTAEDESPYADGREMLVLG
jgi:phage terminase large subunit-like protein